MAVNKKEFADRMAEKGGIKKKDAMKGLELFVETDPEGISGQAHSSLPL